MEHVDKLLRRADIRSPATQAEIRGLVSGSTSGRQEPAIVWNISDSGICIWTTSQFRRGEVLNLTVAKPWLLTLQCEVRWCRALDGTDGFLIGTKVLSNQRRLEALHRKITKDWHGVTPEMMES